MRRPRPRFHGRVENAQPHCAVEGCPEPGEFRAPAAEGLRPAGEGPPQWRWLCLDHVRAFNAGYNFFSGMTADEIEAAQRPLAGWERETRAFSANAAAAAPRWADFTDPIDAISASYRSKMRDAARRHARANDLRQDGKPLSPDDRKAMSALGLEVDADRKALRSAYAALVRRYHPDHNGGNRSHEKALQDVIAAYTHLRKAPAFA
ncbi:J domain-containing protein [Sphingobium subterraneum]|uniref:J domain-containing protein n=1 Tax=Sphingobium subterraneum TaxID=627688 RepID=UPI0031B63BB9